MLQVENLSYKVGRKTILQDFSLTVKTGELVVITGPNGSGKSTLSSLIAGLAKPSAGQILLDSEDITKLDITERARRGIALSYQRPIHFKGVTVRDLLQIAATGHETFLEDNKTNYEKLIAQVGLGPEYLEREVNATLSGGELKRIEIATVLARPTAKLLIFDEPEAGIDLWSFDKLTHIFEKLRGKYTVIIVSHQERILKLADRVVTIGVA